MNFTSFSTAAAIVLSLAAPMATQAQTVKIATVEMNKVFTNYWKTIKLQKELNVIRTRIQKEDEERITRLRDIEKQLVELRKKLEDPLLNEKNKKEMMEKFNRLQQDGIAAERERRDWLERRNRAINEQMGEQMRGITETIQQEVAKQSNGKYDFVFDSSALATSQTKVLLFSNEKNDITTTIMTELNKDAPAEFKPSTETPKVPELPAAPPTSK